MIIPVSVLIYSNRGITELSKRLDDRMSDISRRFDDVSKKIDGMEKNLTEKIDNAFEHMELLLKLHEAEHHKK